MDPALAGELAGLVVDGFLREGGLDQKWHGEALAQLELYRGVTPRGELILRAILPLASGDVRYGWDGSPEEGRAHAVTMGETAGHTVTVERNGGCSTGWEPEGPEDRGP